MLRIEQRKQRASRTVAARAFLLVEMRAANVVVPASQGRGGRNLVDALLGIVIADLQIERGAEETAVGGDVP